ncbi:conjugal transfer protein TraF [Pantoea alhagi]|uniref:Conjugal transfer protein TraF n=1 Tax=Pantoea alhagi TaxID=1891675 RepID=A0A1W6B511_9GAMM|nr:conjugal transfer protein TraF [Pantoea alhagi]ARJ42188.1 conjugal transfer protein TraF [Pantoea alhagi]
MTKKNIHSLKLSPAAVLVPLIFTSFSSLAAGSYFDARNDAMGGTGVASSNYTTAPLTNPALLTKGRAEDNVSVILPSVGVQISDKDKMVDKIDDVTDTVDRYQNVFDDFDAGDLLTDPAGALDVINNVRSASGDLANQLRDLRGNKADGSAGAAIVVAVPNETLPFAFVAKAYGTVHLHTDVAQSDIDYLDAVANGTRFPQAGDQYLLRSSATGVAAIVADYGIAVAHEFKIGEQAVSVGITPKLQQTRLYNYRASVYNFDKDKVTDSEYRTNDTGFNLDAGLSTDVGENWTFGLSAQNLISRDIETKEVNGYRDTYQIRPLVTAGAAWHTEKLTASLDVDATRTKRFKSQADSQYAGVGVEYRVLDWLQLRGGYHADMKSNDVNVVSAGFGISPFNNRVHLDLAGSVGEDDTWGAMAQLGFSF